MGGLLGRGKTKEQAKARMVRSYQANGYFINELSSVFVLSKNTFKICVTNQRSCVSKNICPKCSVSTLKKP